MTSAAITTEALGKRFGSVVALDGLDLEVPAATVVGLLGPNGAGKTTAVRILTTVLHPDAGRAQVLGHDVVAEPEAVRASIGLAGQYAAVDENLTGRENLRLVGRLTHLPPRLVRSQADALLERFDLADAGDRPAKTYSGGMRRRLDLAAALVHRPPILLLDEPTTGLDPQSRSQLWQIIGELLNDGTTVLLTTQYLEEADRLASTVVVVDHGRAIASGTPAELKARLDATVLDIGLPDGEVANMAAKLLAPLSAKPPTVTDNQVELAVEDGPKVLMEVLRLLDRQGVAPTALSLREPSLDDVFLSLTGRPAEEAAEETDDETDETPRGAA